jgi:hypothetical protein
MSCCVVDMPPDMVVGPAGLCPPTCFFMGTPSGRVFHFADDARTIKVMLTTGRGDTIRTHLRTFGTPCDIIRTHDVLELSGLKSFFFKAFGGALWPKHRGVFHQGVAVGACDAPLAV